MRLLLYLFIISFAVRQLTGRWPWAMMRIERSDTRLAQARILLGVDGSAGRAEIISAHRDLVVRVHPDRGGSTALVHEANAARDLLLSALPPSP